MVTAGGLDVVMISFDGSLVTDPQGESRRRHARLAELAGRLRIIAPARPGHPACIEVSPQLQIYPSGSRSTALFPLDALRVAARLGGPVDLIVTQDPFLTGWVGARLRRRWGAPLLAQDHFTIFDNMAWLAEHPVRNRALLWLARWVLARTDMLRTVSDAGLQGAVRAGFPAERARVLPLGTASASFAQPAGPERLAALRAQLGIAPAAPVALWVGRNAPQKRLPLLFESFARIHAVLPAARLVLVGDLPASLRELAVQRGLADAVVFAGRVPFDALPAYYQMAALFLLTSAYEGSPRVLMEAGAAGIPAVCAGAGGTRELIVHGETGWFVEDGPALAQRLADSALALLGDPARAAQMGAAAQARALALYSAERYPERWAALWREAAAAGMRGAR